MRTVDGRRVGIIPVRGTWETLREHALLMKANPGFSLTEALKKGPGGPPFWFRRQSEWARMMAEDYGLSIIDFDGDPDTPNLELWSGRLQGTPLQGWLSRAFNVKDPDWLNGGERHKRLMLKAVKEWDLTLTVAFSHGGQIAAYSHKTCPAYPSLVGRLALITVDTPNRRDQESWYRSTANLLRPGPEAPPNWVHMHSTSMGVWVRWSGAWSTPGDFITGRAFRREMRLARRNIKVKTHGGALYRPRQRMEHWRTALHELGIEPFPGTPSADVPLIKRAA